jgi:glycosyltransferase involved in cell wall biosynthesis
MERELLDKLVQRAQAHGIADRVRFLGQRSDVGQLMRSADIFCQPNIGPESFGLVFIEAMHCGLPVVTTRIGGAIEIFESDSSGVLCTPGDVDGLADALKSLIDSPELCKQIGQRGRARASQLCDVDRQMRQISDTLSLIGWATVQK